MLYKNFATTEEIDAEYNLGLILGDLDPYFNFYSSQSAAARSDLTCSLDVPYGPTVEETLDIFPAENPEAPILIFIHGGYWRRLSSKHFSFVARGLVAHGITVLVTDYALCPKVTLPEITRQSRAAVAWARNTDKKYHGDRERIYVAGHSAGGHQAVRVLCTNWLDDYGLASDTIKGCYAISGLYDLSPIRYAFVQQALQLNDEIIQRESPIFNIPKAAAPLIADVGAEESSEFRRQSADYIKAWKNAGLRGDYFEQTDKHHFNVVDGFLDPDSDLCERVVSMVKS
ncbi:MAG TPA: esterase [Gammaproteobacteria bacterium]|nr:esterase [Gammaproteobacteria bacterium]